MSLLNKEYNNPIKFKELLIENKRQVEVDMDEIEAVIQLALRTPGLSDYIDEFKGLKRYFQDFQNYCRDNNYLDFLEELVKLWELYRAVIFQRYTNITPLELQAADLIVQNIFSRFSKDIR